MKKNVFSRTIAVLASMTVLGAASMMSASAAVEGIKVADVEVPFGSTEATVGLSLMGEIEKGKEPEGCVITVSYPAELTLTDDVLSKALVVDPDSVPGAVSATYAVPAGMKTEFDSITFTLPETDGTADVTYPVDITIDTLDDGQDTQTPVESPVAAGGSITILAAEVEETTAAPTTEAETDTPVVTTAAPATTAKPAATGSPKTGTAGVAVAVAGLVTAGATAVVLKKKH